MNHLLAAILTLMVLGVIVLGALSPNVAIGVLLGACVAGLYYGMYVTVKSMRLP